MEFPFEPVAVAILFTYHALAVEAFANCFEFVVIQNTGPCIHLGPRRLQSGTCYAALSPRKLREP